jgi:hypothetical protein
MNKIVELLIYLLHLPILIVLDMISGDIFSDEN